MRRRRSSARRWMTPTIEAGGRGIASGYFQLPKRVLVPFDAPPQPHRELWQDNPQGASYVYNHALPCPVSAGLTGSTPSAPRTWTGRVAGQLLRCYAQAMRDVFVVSQNLFVAAKAVAILQRAGIGALRRAPQDILAADDVPLAYVVDLTLPEGLRADVLRRAASRAPVVAFGPHSDALSLRAARAAGAETLTNGQLEQDLALTLARLLPKA